jgi:hypothetical protein
MSIHDIHMSMPEKMVLNKDVVFDVYSDKYKLGSLRISKGTIEWAPANFVQGLHLRWEQFDEVMRDFGSKQAGN